MRVHFPLSPRPNSHGPIPKVPNGTLLEVHFQHSGNQFELLTLTPSKIFDSLKSHVEEGGRMLIFTNWKSNKGLQTNKEND